MQRIPDAHAVKTWLSNATQAAQHVPQSRKCEPHTATQQNTTAGPHVTSRPSIFLTLLLPSSSSVSAVRADRLSTAVTLLAAQNSSRRAGVAAGSDDRPVSRVRLRICSRQAGGQAGAVVQEWPTG